ncbi:MAG TPA: toxin-antitoxin system protein [Thermoanaerobacterales bacterium]|nr:toxin-antitoxin system protein [Thermoanaerobacterales bacterium]
MPLTRISEQAYKTLQLLAEKNKESHIKIIEKALEEYRRQIFIKEANVAYAALKTDPDKWKEEQLERKLWEQTISDDLED